MQILSASSFPGQANSGYFARKMRRVVTGVVALFGLTAGIVLADESAELCSYDEQAMLALSPMEFDQSLEHGWPSLALDG